VLNNPIPYVGFGFGFVSLRSKVDSFSFQTLLKSWLFLFSVPFFLKMRIFAAALWLVFCCGLLVCVSYFLK